MHTIRPSLWSKKEFLKLQNHSSWQQTQHPKKPSWDYYDGEAEFIKPFKHPDDKNKSAFQKITLNREFGLVNRVIDHDGKQWIFKAHKFKQLNQTFINRINHLLNPNIKVEFFTKHSS